MIQRIQSVYLLLAASAMFITLILPLGQVESAGLMVEIMISKNIPAMVTGGLSAIVSIAAIFLFKNRPLQMRLSMLAGALSVITLGILLFFAFITHKEQVFSTNYPSLLMPFFAGAFNLLAYRGIKADEQLVRSMDRLR